ncbi:MAG TPA: hypothetical protein VMZ25_03350 [Terriglobales bacterium]|nr:hypothetical protein [Terriglobales bacterium]
MLVIRSFFKALAIAAVSGALFFFLGIFLTLITLLIVSSVTSTKPDLTISYRLVGATAGVTAFVLGFFGTIIFDVRRASRTTS